MAYEKQTWNNEDTLPETPLDAERLNHMEDGIASTISKTEIEAKITIEKERAETAEATGMAYKGTWSSTTTYTINDVTIKNEALFVALKTNEDVEPKLPLEGTAAENWAVIAQPNKAPDEKELEENGGITKHNLKTEAEKEAIGGAKIGPYYPAGESIEIGNFANVEVLKADAEHNRFVIVRYQATAKRTKEEVVKFQLSLKVTVGEILETTVMSWELKDSTPYSEETFLTDEESWGLLLPKGSPLHATGVTPGGSGVMAIFAANLD